MIIINQPPRPGNGWLNISKLQVLATPPSKGGDSYES